jgi:hypothetical protein
VVAGWSGNAQFAEMSNDVLMCEGAGPDQTAKDDCWAAVVRYMSCNIRYEEEGFGPCHDTYYEAEPITAYTSTGPPAFIANGTEELIPVLSAQDLDPPEGSAQH